MAESPFGAPADDYGDYGTYEVAGPGEAEGGYDDGEEEFYDPESYEAGVQAAANVVAEDEAHDQWIDALHAQADPGLAALEEKYPDLAHEETATPIVEMVERAAGQIAQLENDPSLFHRLRVDPEFVEQVYLEASANRGGAAQFMRLWDEQQDPGKQFWMGSGGGGVS
jgi:hypothetical protein